MSQPVVRQQEGRYALHRRRQKRQGDRAESGSTDRNRLQKTDTEPCTQWYCLDGRVPNIQHHEEEPVRKTVEVGWSG